MASGSNIASAVTRQQFPKIRGNKAMANETEARIGSGLRKRNWFMRQLSKWVNGPIDNEKQARERELRDTAFEGYNHNERTIRFSVFFAQGGRIVEAKRWDSNRGEWRETLHIITPDQNFSEEIDKIITIEGLSR